MNERRGAYPADRTAALSGVPLSTVHDWARKGLLIPSVSATRVKLWSFTDLMALRAIYWLRHPKPTPDGHEIPATSMALVREMLAELGRIDLGVWDEEHGYMVRVSREGTVYVGPADASIPLDGQLPLAELDLIAPFEWEDGIRGPDLFSPRPKLRIIAGKLAGAPHLQRTRLETEALAAIAERGIVKQQIYQLYPGFDHEAIDEALDLEAQLARNLRPLSAVA